MTAKAITPMCLGNADSAEATFMLSEMEDPDKVVMPACNDLVALDSHCSPTSLFDHSPSYSPASPVPQPTAQQRTTVPVPIGTAGSPLSDSDEENKQTPDTLRVRGKRLSPRGTLMPIPEVSTEPCHCCGQTVEELCKGHESFRTAQVKPRSSSDGTMSRPASRADPQQDKDLAAIQLDEYMQSVRNFHYRQDLHTSDDDSEESSKPASHCKHTPRKRAGSTNERAIKLARRTTTKEEDEEGIF
jgi:hypothetical protein